MMYEHSWHKASPSDWSVNRASNDISKQYIHELMEQHMFVSGIFSRHMRSRNNRTRNMLRYMEKCPFYVVFGVLCLIGLGLHYAYDGLYQQHRRLTEAIKEYAEKDMAFRTLEVAKMCVMINECESEIQSSSLYTTEYQTHIVVFEDKQILYCYLPKVGNRRFKRAFQDSQLNIEAFNEFEDFVIDGKIKYLKDFNTSTQSHMLNHYRKFMAVGNPLERLMTAYLSKFKRTNTIDRDAFIVRVLSFYANHPDLVSPSRINISSENEEVTFHDFLVWWSDMYKYDEVMNEHFLASYQLCDPCGINYDYIAKLETLKEDMIYIFSKWNIKDQFPGRNANMVHNNATAMIRDMYSGLPDWLHHRIWDILKHDFMLFGYFIPEWFVRTAEGEQIDVMRDMFPYVRNIRRNSL